MAKKVIGYQITNSEENIPEGLYSFQVFKTSEDAFRYLRVNALNRGLPVEKCWFVKEYYEGDIEEPTYISSKKKMYNVTLYFHTNTTVFVEAENEKEAIELARMKACEKGYTQDLLNGLQEDGAPDVCDVE